MTTDAETRLVRLQAGDCQQPWSWRTQGDSLLSIQGGCNLVRGPADAGFGLPASRAMRGYVAIILGYRVCAKLMPQTWRI